jgi:hypothetical protein
VRAQIDDDLLLAGIERGLQPVRCVAAILDRAALAPLADREFADTEALRQFGLSAVARLDRQACRRRRRSVLRKLISIVPAASSSLPEGPSGPPGPQGSHIVRRGAIHPGLDKYAASPA